MLQQFFLILALGLTVFSPFAAKAEASDELELYMVMTMTGLTAGSIKLSIEDQGSQTVSKLTMKSQGFFKFLTGYKSKAKALSTGSIDGASSMPITYDSTYETNDSERRVEIRYDDETGEIDKLGSWKRGEPRKPKVSAALQSATIDPLTAMIRFRHWISDLRNGSEGQKVSAIKPAVKRTAFDVFDGRRRYRLDIELLERQKIRHAGRRVPALRFKVEMEALAGFSKNDMLAGWSSENGQRWIEVIITDDENPVPISMSTIGGGLKTSVHLRKICNGKDRCEKVDG